MMIFLNHSAFGASEGSGRGEVVEKIFNKLFIDKYEEDPLPQISENYKIAAAKALEHILFLENLQPASDDKDLDLRLKNLRDCLYVSPMWQNTFHYWFSHFVKREEVGEILLSMKQG